MAKKQIRSIIDNLTRMNGFELDITEAVQDFLINCGPLAENK